MAFKGTLKEFKVPDILQLVSLQKKTGILTFNSPEGFITVIFEDGSIVGIDAFPRKLEMRVGSVLVKQELISEEMLQRALAIQKRTGQKVGEILTAMGLIGEKTMPEALKTQATQIILSLFNWKKGEYNFKVMDSISAEMKTLEPLATDKVIMEGVQMLDEWPQIRKAIPSEDYVFEPIPLENKRIEVVSDYDDEVQAKDGHTAILTESEVSLLKRINGHHSVADLVDMGFVTEYKIYKNLFNLYNKGIIRPYQKTKYQEMSERKLLEKALQSNVSKIQQLQFGILALLLLMFLLTFFKPFRPIKNDNVLLKRDLLQKVFSVDSQN